MLPVMAFGSIEIVWFSGEAGFQLASPGWDAWIVTDPAPVIVRVLFETAAGPESTL